MGSTFRGQFGQNGQKLNENYKIGILWVKSVGGTWGGGQTIFLASGGDPPSLPSLGETLSTMPIRIG